EEPIAGLVPEAVVDRLEGVEVEKKDCDRLLAAVHAVERVLEAVGEERAVRELGERVVEGLMRETAESLPLCRAKHRVLDDERPFERDLRHELPLLVAPAAWLA